MIKSLHTIAITLFCGMLLASCEKKPLPVDPGTVDPSGFGKVKLEFFNKVGASKLTLHNQWYKNEYGDSFYVNTFNYYISNIVLNGAKGNYTETESYHLVKQGVDSSMSFDLNNVPYGTYSSLTVMIGVDSARNVSGAQTGALDPTNEMFWGWKTGYIMLKLEGFSPQSTGFDSVIMYHIGGHAGDYKGQRTVTLNFANPITVGKDGENHVHIDADVSQLFKSPNVISFEVSPVIMSIDRASQKLADNYANMLSVSYSGL